MNKEIVRLCNPYDLTTGSNFSSIQHSVTDFSNVAKCVYCAVGTEYILFNVGEVTNVIITAHHVTSRCAQQQATYKTALYNEATNFHPAIKRGNETAALTT